MIGIRPTNSQVGRVGYGYIYIYKSANESGNVCIYVKNGKTWPNILQFMEQFRKNQFWWMWVEVPNMLFCCSQNCHWKITCNATYNASDDTANTRRIRYWIPAEETVLEQRSLPLIHESMVNLWLTKKQLLLVGWWCSIKDISTINHAQSLMVHQKHKICCWLWLCSMSKQLKDYPATHPVTRFGWWLWIQSPSDIERIWMSSSSCSTSNSNNVVAKIITMTVKRAKPHDANELLASKETTTDVEGLPTMENRVRTGLEQLIEVNYHPIRRSLKMGDPQNHRSLMVFKSFIQCSNDLDDLVPPFQETSIYHGRAIIVRISGMLRLAGDVQAMVAVWFDIRTVWFSQKSLD